MSVCPWINIAGMFVRLFEMCLCLSVGMHCEPVSLWKHEVSLYVWENKFCICLWEHILSVPVVTLCESVCGKTLVPACLWDRSVGLNVCGRTL
jgi:hypothetical protein